MLEATSKTDTQCIHIHKTLTERVNFGFDFKQTAYFVD